MAFPPVPCSRSEEVLWLSALVRWLQLVKIAGMVPHGIRLASSSCIEYVSIGSSHLRTHERRMNKRRIQFCSGRPS